jgi:hypothetical protein
MIPKWNIRIRTAQAARAHHRNIVRRQRHPLIGGGSVQCRHRGGGVRARPGMSAGQLDGCPRIRFKEPMHRDGTRVDLVPTRNVQTPS